MKSKTECFRSWTEMKTSLQRFDPPSGCWETTQTYVQRVLSWAGEYIFHVHGQSSRRGKRVVRDAQAGSKINQNNPKQQHFLPAKRTPCNRIGGIFYRHAQSRQPETSSAFAVVLREDPSDFQIECPYRAVRAVFRPAIQKVQMQPSLTAACIGKYHSCCRLAGKKIQNLNAEEAIKAREETASKNPDLHAGQLLSLFW